MDYPPSPQVTGTNRQLAIRVSRSSLSFSTVMVGSEGSTIAYEPYTVKSGISMAANLREAFKTADLPGSGFRRAIVLIDSPVQVVPIDLFRPESAEQIYRHAFPRGGADRVEYNVLPWLNAVALFAVNKDLRLVIDDHFADVRMCCALTPVWKYLHQRSFIGSRSKLYAYFHDRKADIFSFAQNRFKFCNAFDVSSAHDALYYLLYVWKQLMLKPERDEMHIVGDIPDQDWIMAELRRFLKRAFTINPVGDFNRAPATLIKGMPYDLVTYYVKGR